MARELTIYDYVPTFPVERQSGGWTYNLDATRMPEAEHAKLRAKIEGAYLGPWCPQCGRKGERCRNRDACTLRRILAGKRTAVGMSLGEPPLPWLVARRFVHAGAHRGGYVRTGLLKYDRRAAALQYAYEVAMGRADVGVVNDPGEAREEVAA